MINIPLILILIILSITAVYFAGKYNLLARLFILGKKIILALPGLLKINLSPQKNISHQNLLKTFHFPKKYLKIVGIFVCGILVFIIISTIYNNIADSKARKEGCQPFTPLLLEKYKTASGEKPILGERCTLSRNSFLIKILYENSKQAQNALTGLISEIEGERKTLENYPWITYQKSSSIFLVDGQKAGVLVLLGTDKEAVVRKELNTVLKNEWIKESGNLTYESGAIPVKPTLSQEQNSSVSEAAKTSSDTEEILVEARRYVEMHAGIIKFDLRITNKLGDYALVTVIPQEDAEGASVILQKVDNRWVAQEMGTAFPQWEGRVPELFKW